MSKDIEITYVWNTYRPSEEWMQAYGKRMAEIHLCHQDLEMELSKPIYRPISIWIPITGAILGGIIGLLAVQ